MGNQWPMRHGDGQPLKYGFSISRWVVTGCANLLSKRTQKMTLVCGKMRSSILDVWSLRGLTSAEDIQKA